MSKFPIASLSALVFACASSGPLPRASVEGTGSAPSNSGPPEIGALTAPVRFAETIDPSLLKLSLTIERTDPGEPPEVRIALTNRTKSRNLWVNYRFGLGRREISSRDIWFEMTDVHGARVSFTCWVNTGSPRASDYIVLAPGAEVSATQDLRCFDLPAKGNVRIVAHYKDPSSMPPRQPVLTEWFSGELVSEPLELSIGEQPDQR